MQPPEAINVNLGIPRSPLILVGASVRAAAQSAARAGFRVTGVDLFGDCDTIDACENYIPLDPSTLARLEKLHPNPLTPLAVVGGLQPSQRGIIEIQNRYRSIGGVAYQHCLGPDFLRQAAKMAGIRFPNSRLEPGIRQDSRSRWLIKDRDGCGGLAVRRATGTAPSRSQYAQAWVPGRPFGATFSSDGDGATLLGVCRGSFTKLGDRPFVYAGSVGPVVLPADQLQTIAGIGAPLAKLGSLKGLFNVDLIIDGNDLWLLEVNPRWSASCELIERAMTDAGALGEHESLMGHAMGTTKSNLSFDPRTQYLKRIVYSRRAGRFDHDRIQGAGAWGAELADVPQQGSRVGAGEPILSVIIAYQIETPMPWQRLRQLFARVQNAIR